MKTIQPIRPFLLVLILSLAMATSLEVSSKNYRNNKSDRDTDHKEYRDDRSYSSDDDDDDDDDDDRGDKKHYKKHKSNRNNGHYEYSQRYSERPNHYQKRYSNHPKYGRVYQRFDHNPYVFRHSHGNYYYSDNQFYTYRDGIGYCATEPPRQVYFRDLPFNCSRENVNGQVFFRNGDLYFSHSPRGYEIVPAPIHVNFSIGF